MIFGDLESLLPGREILLQDWPCKLKFLTCIYGASVNPLLPRRPFPSFLSSMAIWLPSPRMPLSLSVPFASWWVYQSFGGPKPQVHTPGTWGKKIFITSIKSSGIRNMTSHSPLKHSNLTAQAPSHWQTTSQGRTLKNLPYLQKNISCSTTLSISWATSVCQTLF